MLSGTLHPPDGFGAETLHHSLSLIYKEQEFINYEKTKFFYLVKSLYKKVITLVRQPLGKQTDFKYE